MQSVRRLSVIFSALRVKASRETVHSPVRPSRQHQTMSDAGAKTGKTAGLLVIGDEILRGDTQDTNSSAICKRLHELGVSVPLAVVIPDRIDVIAQHVATLSAAHDYVLTSGGVGPTHDDVTYAGVARAFGLQIVRHPELIELIELWFGNDHTHPAFRMSEVPESSRVVYSRDTPARFPAVQVRNVYILPGIPAYMERSLNCVVDDLTARGELADVAPTFTASVYVSVDEVSIAEPLNQVVRHFGERAKFGSYPVVDHSFYRVRLSIESSCADTLAEAETYLRERLPPGALVAYDVDPVDRAADKLYSALPEDSAAPDELRRALRQATDALESCLEQYGPNGVCLSFNGGKDCTVLLHLLYTVLRRKYPEHTAKLNVLYVRVDSPFAEMEQFSKEAAKRYHVELHTVPSPIKSGLNQFLIANPQIKSILVGNRRTDPHSQNLTQFQMTDSNWPKVMRVFPLLDWSYQDVWMFLRYFSIPYCSLYDKGYTSLGNVKNTTRNPKLQTLDRLGRVTYLPAYKLENGDEERCGRI